MRTLVLWCPDWPVVAAVLDGTVRSDEPAAVFHANRVVAASASARMAGVRRSMRRREAQARCPELEVLRADEAREARTFETVVAAVTAFAPLVEIVRPGWCQLATRGPARYFGGEETLVARLREVVNALGVQVRIGVADGAAAAALAARSGSSGSIFPSGRSAEQLAVMPVSCLDHIGEIAPCGTAAELQALAGLWARLGLVRLGLVAQLPALDVATRFGPLGAWAYAVATGNERRIARPRRPPSDLVVEAQCDPPLERIDTAAFVARGLAEQLVDTLAASGSACTCIRIEAVIEDSLTGERSEVIRRWRHERAGAVGALNAATLADRVRWQLEGWLQSGQADSGRSGVGAAGAVRVGAVRVGAIETGAVETGVVGAGAVETGVVGAGAVETGVVGAGAIVVLRLVPEEVVADGGRQLTLWGGPTASDERAARAFSRIQALIGPEAVRVPARRGGRRPSDFVTLVAWGDALPPERRGPWPGVIPPPYPSAVHDPPWPTEICDAGGKLVVVSGRGELSAVPHTMLIAGRLHPITQWAGPWPLDERWWDPAEHRRQARLQLMLRTEGYLAVLEAGAWWVEGTYG